MQHDWVKSTLGHGEAMCSRCKITNREAAVLGLLNICDVPPASPTDTYTAANGEELPRGEPGTTIVNDGRPT
jgi:hypothetical protein